MRIDILLPEEEVVGLNVLKDNRTIEQEDFFDILIPFQKLGRQVDLFYSYFEKHYNSRRGVDDILHYKQKKQLDLKEVTNELRDSGERFIVCFGHGNGYATKVLEGKRKKFYKFNKIVTVKKEGNKQLIIF